jgi:hypothetical protein
MFKYEEYGDNAIIHADDVSFTFESVENPRELDDKRSEKSSLEWTDQDYQLSDYTVFPFGATNNLPKEIKEVVQNNYIAPGILKKKSQLLWGKGPKLYKESFKDGVLIREWLDDKEISEWMDQWDAETYLMQACVDFHHVESVATKFFIDKSSRLGLASKFAKLEHVNINKARLANKSTVSNSKATHCIYLLDQRESQLLQADFKVYPIFDYINPFQYITAIHYSNMYSFCSDYYTVPDIYGSLEWLRRASAIPLILKALSKNSINLKYHIVSPNEHWEKQRELIKKDCEQKKIEYKESMLRAYKKDYLREITRVLSGEDNTGKFWHTIKYLEVKGNNILEHGWEIKEIKQNIKDFVSAQIQISDQSNRAVAAGLGVHQALGGSGEKGKTDGGGEQLYALKNYLATGIDIPEMIVCKAINYAIKANWPTKAIKVGFYHIAPEREENITSSKRFKEQVG